MKTKIFYSLFLITVFSFCFLINKNFEKLSFSKFSPIFNKMNVIIEGDIKNSDDVILKINNDYFYIQKINGITNEAITKNVRNLDILIKEKKEKEIKNIIVFNDTKTSIFTDFSEFKKNEIIIQTYNKNIKYSKYTFPESIKYNKNSSSINYHSNLNSFCAIIFSIFSFKPYFILSYVLFFITLIYFLSNKKEIKNYFDYKFFLILCAIIGICFYINDFGQNALCCDEYYSVLFSNPFEPLYSVFKDAGNPPLYYILLKIIFSFFGITIKSTRILSLFFAIGLCISTYLFLNKNFDKKTALLGLFLTILTEL